MTLSKLAQLANVSVSVVSKAFSGKEGVSEAMREHVFAVARENGCFQQFYHVPYDKPVVAVIIPEAISGFYIKYIEILKKSMEEKGYTMLLSISNFDRQLADELVRYYTEHGKVEGLLLVDSAETLPQNSTTAIVSLKQESEVGACVGRDLRGAICSCLRYLKEKGHRYIGYVGEPLTVNKLSMLEEEMRKMDLEIRDEWMVTTLSRFENAGREGVKRILRASEKPTVIIGAYSYITQGILKELSESGLRVPQDISVVSMDNEPGPLDRELDVACISSGIEELCEEMMRYLDERIGLEDPNTPAKTVLSATFWEGNSIADLRTQN